MRYTLLVLAILVFAFSLWRFFGKKNETSVLQNKEPITSIKFSDSLIEMGTSKYHVPVNANFIIYNTGDSDLYIQSVDPDCHCTTAIFSRKPIAPSDSSVITLKYDASNLGSYQSSTMVTTNSSTPNTLLIFRGVVIQ